MSEKLKLNVFDTAGNFSEQRQDLNIIAHVPLLNPLQELEGRAGDLSIKCIHVEMLVFASLNGTWDRCFLVVCDVLHNMLLQTIVIDKVMINT